MPRSSPVPAAAVEDGTFVRRLEFVEVATGARVPPARVVAAATLEDHTETVPDSTPPLPSPETRWSLWGDLEG